MEPARGPAREPIKGPAKQITKMNKSQSKNKHKHKWSMISNQSFQRGQFFFSKKSCSGCGKYKREIFVLYHPKGCNGLTKWTNNRGFENV